MVQLYDHNFKLLVWPWKLLSVFLKPLRRRWNVKTSLVDVFASFIYLSSARLLVTSMNFLIPIRAYQQESQGHMSLEKTYLLFNTPLVEYFRKSHLPYGIVAITMSFMFYFLPMILLFVYPFAWFQQILNKIGFNSLTLRTFVEVFQGHFKDGTNNTRDYRYFSGFLLLFPLLENLTFSMTQSTFYYSIAEIWLLIYLILHLVFRPYKRSAHNYVTAVMLLALLGFFWGMSLNAGVAAVQFGSFNDEYVIAYDGAWLLSIVLCAVSICVPAVYLLCLLCLLIVQNVFPCK